MWRLKIKVLFLWEFVLGIYTAWTVQVYIRKLRGRFVIKNYVWRGVSNYFCIKYWIFYKGEDTVKWRSSGGQASFWKLQGWPILFMEFYKADRTPACKVIPNVFRFRNSVKTTAGSVCSTNAYYRTCYIM